MIVEVDGNVICELRHILSLHRMWYNENPAVKENVDIDTVMGGVGQ